VPSLTTAHNQPRPACQRNKRITGDRTTGTKPEMADPHYDAGLAASSRCQPATRSSRRTCPPDVYRAEATLATTPDGGGRPELPDLRAATRACGTAPQPRGIGRLGPW
jgi:hypothetical protein